MNAFFGKQRVIVEESTSFVEQMFTAYIVTEITLSSLVKEERADQIRGNVMAATRSAEKKTPYPAHP